MDLLRDIAEQRVTTVFLRLGLALSLLFIVAALSSCDDDISQSINDRLIREHDLHSVNESCRKQTEQYLYDGSASVITYDCTGKVCYQFQINRFPTSVQCAKK